jgi:hypothetical protein
LWKGPTPKLATGAFPKDTTTVKPAEVWGRNSPCGERVCDWTSALSAEKIIQDLSWDREVLCMHCCHNCTTLFRVIIGFDFDWHVLCHERFWLTSVHWRGDARRRCRQSFSAIEDIYAVK